MDWICHACGAMNEGSDQCACGAFEPDRGALVQVLGGLSVNNGTVFNAPVVVNNGILPRLPEAEKDEDPKPEGRSALATGVVWASATVIGVCVFLFALLLFAGAWGWP